MDLDRDLRASCARDATRLEHKHCVLEQLYKNKIHLIRCCRMAMLKFLKSVMLKLPLPVVGSLMVGTPFLGLRHMLSCLTSLGLLEVIGAVVS